MILSFYPMPKTKKTLNLKNYFIDELKQNKLKYFAIFALLPLFFALYQIYIPRINAFGCFDDCNNFMRGYFVLQGKALFLEVFSGHQPLGSYLSTIIQYFTQPQNIFELILRHRQFMIIFALIMNALIIYRFGAVFLLFTVIYEFSKFYIFGDRFLGDGMIVYPLIYIVGLIFLKYQNLKIYLFDYILVAIFVWFIIFMRVTYAPVAMVSFIFFLWKWPILPFKKEQIMSIAVFTVLSLITIIIHDIGEYFYNVVFFNYQINLQAEAKPEMFGPWYLHWFFYPIFVYFYGPINEFKNLLIGLNSIFIILFLGLIWKKEFKLALAIFLILGFSNIRTVLPGSIFYGAFHMISWFGLIIFISIELIKKLSNSKLRLVGFGFMIGVFLVFLSSPGYFAKSKTDSHQEFITNYGSYLQEGEALRALSSEGDTLFIDGSDDLIYWQSGLSSPYKYSWYTSSMNMLEKYSKEREIMFKDTPPTFYREYGYCVKDEDYEFTEAYKIPEIIKENYTRLLIDEKPSCIYVMNEKLGSFSEDQLKKASEFKFTIPIKQDVQ